MSYTPGPWRVDGVEVFGADGQHVVWELGNRNMADWHLIAAAPDLLVACKMALNDRMFKDWPEIATALMAAIEKAEGEKPPE